MPTQLHCHTYKQFADQVTPIGIYLYLRDLYPGSILLESSEVADKTNARSIIAVDPIGGISLSAAGLSTRFGESKTLKPLSAVGDIREELNAFFRSFSISGDMGSINGFFGYQSFEAVRWFESPKANLCPQADPQIHLIDYRLYRYVISINHFNGELSFTENCQPHETPGVQAFAEQVLKGRRGTYGFRLTDDEQASCTDKQFLEKVRQAQHHCRRGDVFQMVVSRRFTRRYQGDEFNVYRALRHVNPSPYMFFFDFGAYKIFGSSPEAQLRVNGSRAIINPIAGTYKRSGDKALDELAAEALRNDTKEVAEHAMLVDLARNDLNRHCSQVQVGEYQSIHHYSHVIHMVSTVEGRLRDASQGLQVLADTFPAGTLSGAPKVRAIQLLAAIENDPRGFYGGSIGFIDFDGNINQAIIIRSFLARNNELHYRAGAGVVLKSVPESELQEVHNKLAALRKALTEAEKL